MMQRVGAAGPLEGARRLRPLEGVLAHLLDLLDHHRRQGIRPAADLDEHRLDDRSGERQPDGEAGSLPRRGRKLDPSPEAAHFAHHHVEAHAAPGELGHRFGGRQPGRKDELGNLLVAAGLARLQQPVGRRLCANPPEVEAGAVVSEHQRDFVALLAHFEADLAHRRLALRGAHFGRFEAVGDRVAQQVLERPGHALQRGPVQFDVHTADVEVGALGDFLRGLAHDAVQALDDRTDRHHADAHQVLLQFAVQARLGGQRRVGVVGDLVEGLLHGRNVIDALGHHPGQLLEAREPVELERVETAVGGLCRMHSRSKLRLGRDFNLAQLAAQACDVLGEFPQRGLEPVHLGFDSRARDRHLARLVDELLEHVGAHAHHRVDLRFLALHGGFARCDCGFTDAPLDHRLSGSLFGRLGLRMLHPLEQEPDPVVRDFEVVEELARREIQRDGVLDARLHVVGEFAQPHCARHARATLERVERTLHCAGRIEIRRGRPPGPE